MIAMYSMSLLDSCEIRVAQSLFKAIVIISGTIARRWEVSHASPSDNSAYSAWPIGLPKVRYRRYV